MTAEFLAELEAEALREVEKLPPLPWFAPGELVEMYMAGGWLGEELVTRGADEAAKHNQCFAHGQVCAALAIAGHLLPWEAARAIRRIWLAGRRLRPGPRLAVQLMIYSQVWRPEKMPDVDALVEALAEPREQKSAPSGPSCTGHGEA